MEIKDITIQRMLRVKEKDFTTRREREFILEEKRSKKQKK